MKLKTKFQNEDFDLGEVVEGVIVECLGGHEEKLRVIVPVAKGGQHTFYYSSIKKFMDDWEDAPEEPVRHWFISGTRVYEENGYSDEGIASLESVGNHFKSKEEAEKAVEKLKAWKILKNNGFRFIDWEFDLKTVADGRIWFDVGVNAQWNAEQLLEQKPEVKEALDLLFGGEE